MNIDIVLLIVGLLGASYSYFIYPILLQALPKQNPDPISASAEPATLPFLSLIITAYNEQARIKDKIINTLALDYPADKREILIASDGSTDQTNALVSEFQDQGVRLVEVAERKGKENAQLAAIQASKGELLVFSDVATQIPENALLLIASTFADHRIGALSSEDRFITESGEVAGEGAYVKYEMWLRRLEARVKSLIGLSGSFFACRRDICQNWDINVPSDFNTALNCVEQGCIAISHPQILGFYPNLKDESREYQRKLRTVIRGMAAMLHKPQVLNPFRYGRFAFMIFSHKIMRWLVPWFQLLLLFSSISAWQSGPLIMALVLAQCLFYSLALTGWLSPSLRSRTLFKIPFFFMQVNLAIAHAALLFISGKRITRWEPSKR